MQSNRRSRHRPNTVSWMQFKAKYMNKSPVCLWHSQAGTFLTNCFRDATVGCSDSRKAQGHSWRNADVLWRLQHNSICEHAGERKCFGHLKCVSKGRLLHNTEHNMIYLTMSWCRISNLVLHVGNISVHNVFVRVKNVFDMLAALLPSQYIQYIFCFYG